MSKANALAIRMILEKIARVLARLSETAAMLSMRRVATDIDLLAKHAERVAKMVGDGGE